MMGLGNKLRDKLAQQFLECLQLGQLPWTVCWQSSRPENAITDKLYRGVNALYLSYYADELGFQDPRWCTYRQAQEAGWQVLRGSTGCPVEYWAYYDTKQKKLLSWKEAGPLLKDPEYVNKYLQLRCRTYTVFNAAQISGIPKLELSHTDIGQLRQQRDTLLQNMRLGYREEGDRAYYSCSGDTVVLPPEQAFDSQYSYLCTFLHECGHATGHESRLGRDLSGNYGSESYAREELRAEIASAFTAQAIGLHLSDEQLQYHLDQHKAYVQSWAQILQDAPAELFRAIKVAEEISDYLIEKGEFPVLEAAPAQVKTQELSNLTGAQRQEINAGRSAGLTEAQIAVFSNPAFSPLQMNALRYAFSLGLSLPQIEILANPDLSSVQMDALRTCFLGGMPQKTIEDLAQSGASTGQILDAFREVQEASVALEWEP